MHFVWILLLLPAIAGEPTTAFPQSFTSKRDCVRLAEILITKWEFRCVLHRRAVKLAGPPNLDGPA